MSDEQKPRPGSIVGPDGQLPKSRRNQIAREQRPVTVEECREWITAGSISAMKRVYDQLSEESSMNLVKLEEQVTLRVLAELRRRSWRGRLYLRWLLAKEWIRGVGIELGLVDPLSRRSDIKIEPPALEVLDAPS